MSAPITAEAAREVLEIALIHAPEALEELLRMRREVTEADGDMSRGQSTGPYAQPAAAAIARERLEAALSGAALEVEDYATTVAAKVALL